MILSIITAALPLLLKIIGFILDRIKDNKEAKEAFLKFLKSIEPHSKACVRLRKSYMSQRDANLEKIKK